MQHRSATLVFLTFALLTSLGWPDDCAAQTKIPRVGILTVDMRLAGDQAKYWWEPFRRTLAQQGWIEGKSVSFEYGNVRTDPSRFADAAAELVQLNVDVIWAPSAPAVRAAHAATRTIPIVALDATTDPVTEGYVESYNRPGGNITGVFLDAPEIAGKWFELLHAMVGLGCPASLCCGIRALGTLTCRPSVMSLNPWACNCKLSKFGSRTTSKRLSRRSGPSELKP